MAISKKPQVLFISLVLVILSASYFYYPQQNTQATQLIQVELNLHKQELLNQSDVLQLNWLHTLNPLVKKVQGSVIWSSARQSGIMMFENLPALGMKHSYRLWIYDLESRNNQPISAGVFKPVAAEKTLYIRIYPDSRVKKPFKFELVLIEANNSSVQPLLLAQP